MNASEVKVVRVGDKPRRDPLLTSGWVYPFQIIEVTRSTGRQEAIQAFATERDAREHAVAKADKVSGGYYYILDMSTMLPVEIPA